MARCFECSGRCQRGSGAECPPTPIRSYGTGAVPLARPATIAAETGQKRIPIIFAGPHHQGKYPPCGPLDSSHGKLPQRIQFAVVEPFAELFRFFKMRQYAGLTPFSGGSRDVFERESDESCVTRSPLRK